MELGDKSLMNWILLPKAPLLRVEAGSLASRATRSGRAFRLPAVEKRPLPRGVQDFIGDLGRADNRWPTRSPRASFGKSASHAESLQVAGWSRPCSCPNLDDLIQCLASEGEELRGDLPPRVPLRGAGSPI